MPTPQLQGTGLKMLLELLEVKLDPESSREQELSSHEQEQREWAGLGSGEPWREGRGLHRIQEGKDLVQAVVWGTGLGSCWCRAEQGNPVAMACSSLASTAPQGEHLAWPSSRTTLASFTSFLKPQPGAHQSWSWSRGTSTNTAGRATGSTGTDLSSVPRAAELRV